MKATTLPLVLICLISSVVQPVQAKDGSLDPTTVSLEDLVVLVKDHQAIISELKATVSVQSALLREVSAFVNHDPSWVARAKDAWAARTEYSRSRSHQSNKRRAATPRRHLIDDAKMHNTTTSNTNISSSSIFTPELYVGSIDLAGVPLSTTLDALALKDYELTTRLDYLAQGLAGVGALSPAPTSTPAPTPALTGAPRFQDLVVRYSGPPTMTPGPKMFVPQCPNWDGNGFGFGVADDNSASSNSVVMEMSRPVQVYSFAAVTNAHLGGSYFGNAKLFGSNDEASWVDLATLSGDGICASLGPDYVPLAKYQAYTFFKISMYGNSRAAYEAASHFVIGLSGG